MSSGGVRCVSNVVDFFLECQFAELLDRKGEEQADPPVEHEECIAVSTLDFSSTAFNSGGVGNAPMGSNWLSGPDRANFLRCVVADGEDEVQLGRVWFREFIPRLAARAPGRYSRRLKLTKGRGPDDSAGMAAC